MTAIEHVEKLKADRRAELAAKAAEEERVVRDLAERKRAAWMQGVVDALAELGEGWLLPFRAPDKDRDSFNANSRTYREAAFAVPGHRVIVLRMEDICYHNEFKWRVWPPENSGWMATWAVANGSAVEGYPTLSDALIAAELKPGDADEPIPY